MIAALPCDRIVWSEQRQPIEMASSAEARCTTADIAVSTVPSEQFTTLSPCFWLKFVHVLIRFWWSGVRGRRYFVLESANRWTLIWAFYTCLRFWFVVHENYPLLMLMSRLGRKFRRRHLSQFIKKTQLGGAAE